MNSSRLIQRGNNPSERSRHSEQEWIFSEPAWSRGVNERELSAPRPLSCRCTPSLQPALLAVDFLTQESARFEGENLAGGNGKWFAGLGIAAGTVTLLLNTELAETGEFNFLTRSQGFFNDVQNGLNDLLGFFSLEVAVCSNVFYQVFFCHGKDFYHTSNGNSKRESPEGPLYGSNLPEQIVFNYFFLAAFFFFSCTAS